MELGSTYIIADIHQESYWHEERNYLLNQSVRLLDEDRFPFSPDQNFLNLEVEVLSGKLKGHRMYISGIKLKEPYNGTKVL